MAGGGGETLENVEGGSHRWRRLKSRQLSHSQHGATLIHHIHAMNHVKMFVIIMFQITILGCLHLQEDKSIQTEDKTYFGP